MKLSIILIMFRHFYRKIISSLKKVILKEKYFVLYIFDLQLFYTSRLMTFLLLMCCNINKFEPINEIKLAN